MIDCERLLAEMNAHLGDLKGEARLKEMRRIAGLGISNASDKRTRVFWVAFYKACERESAEAAREVICLGEGEQRT